MKATIYTKDNCGYCLRAKALLNAKDIPYDEIDAVENKDDLIEKVTAATGNPPRTVPQIWVDNDYVGGYDQLVKYLP